MADPVRYTVTCCQGEVDGGRIDDNRPAGGSVVIDPDNSFRVKTAGLQCEECEQAVKLGTRDIGELIDAIRKLQEEIGKLQEEIGYDTLEGRRVIPLNLMCTVNGGLQRRKTATRRAYSPKRT